MTVSMSCLEIFCAMPPCQIKCKKVTRLNSSFSQLFQITNLFKVSDCSFKRSHTTNPSALSNRARDFLHFPKPPRPNKSNTIYFLFSLYYKKESEREGDEQKEQKWCWKTIVEKQQHSLKSCTKAFEKNCAENTEADWPMLRSLNEVGDIHVANGFASPHREQDGMWNCQVHLKRKRNCPFLFSKTKQIGHGTTAARLCLDLGGCDATQLGQIANRLRADQECHVTVTMIFMIFV